MDLAGGWTDVAAYAGRRGGVVVNAALTLYVHVLVRRGGTGVRLHARALGPVVSAPRLEDPRPAGVPAEKATEVSTHFLDLA